MTLLVQSNPQASSGTTITLTLNGVGAGSTIIVAAITQSSSGTASSISDTNGTYTLAKDSGSFGTGTGEHAMVWYMENAASGTHTATVTQVSTARPSWGVICEVSGLLTSGSLDTSASGGGTTAQSLATGSTATLAQAIEFAIAIGGMTSSGAGSANIGITDPPTGASWLTVAATQDDTSSKPGAECAYIITAATTALSASWTWTDANTRSSAGAIATFKAAAATADNSALLSFIQSKLAGPFTPTQFSQFPYSRDTPPPPPIPLINVGYIPRPGPGKGPDIRTLFVPPPQVYSTSPSVSGDSTGGSGSYWRRRRT